MEETKTVLIAGGSGLIGTELSRLLSKSSYKVKFLSRNKSTASTIFWNPQLKEIDEKEIQDVSILINLAGANIGQKRWSIARKKELIESRVNATEFLSELAEKMPKLSYYVGASGVNCYPLSEDKVFTEEDSYGTDFLSTLVRDWEAASDRFEGKCPYMKLRIAMVLSNRGGSLAVMKRPIYFGLGSPIGKGTQYHPWIHIEDLCRMILFGIEQHLTGTYHAVAHCDTNRDMMKGIAKHLHRPFFLPAIPAGILKIMLGEKSMLVLSDLRVSNDKIKKEGFQFKFENLNKALKSLI
ncbi:MAG: TIGR01777 family oxidoreductase [Flavobacteriales bacterium]